MAVTNKYNKSISGSKIIVYLFFIVYLIILGVIIPDFINVFQKTHTSGLPIFLSYLPLAFFAFAVFLSLSFFIFLRNLSIGKTRKKSVRKKKTGLGLGSVYKQALFIVIFIFAFVPLFSPIIDQGQNTQYFSIYNSNPDSPYYWRGASIFKQEIENEGYDVLSIQSSLSATQRLNKSILLVLLGPNQNYNPVFEIPYFIDFFGGKNSILICHDYGSTSMLLWEIFLANLINKNQSDIIPVTIFPEGTLRDNQSYAKRPDFPVIEWFEPHPTTKGVKKVVLSEASCALGGPFVDIFGWTVVGRSSFYSYVDMNGDGVYKYDDDNIDLSFMSDYIPQLPEGLTKFPLGGYPQSVFMAKDTGNVRVFVSGDASLFSNELISEPGYDNLQFGKNIIDWLTRGGNKDDWVVVFDEAHIRPEYSRDLSSAGIFGFIMQYIIHLSTNPITAWIYPLLAIYTFRKYVPKKSKEEERRKAQQEKKREDEMQKFRTSSFFAEKINWYRENRRYDKALSLLFRRVERKLNILLGEEKITTKNVINMIIQKEPNVSKYRIGRLAKFMDEMIQIKKGGRRIKNEREFENLFFEMEWAMSNI